MYSTPTKTKAPTMVPDAPKKAKKSIAHCSQLPRVHSHGFVKQFANAISEEQHDYFYDATRIGSIMERIYAGTDQQSRYEAVKASIASVDHVSDFTLDLIFRMMNIREHVDERMAMEIAEFIQNYLPQRTFTKTTITVNSVDIFGEPVTKVLEVKLYYAYEMDAVMWLIKAFFNKSDLIDETDRQLKTLTTFNEVLYSIKDVNPMVQTLFFGLDDAVNAMNHLTYQTEMMTMRFPSAFHIFHPTDMTINGYTIHAFVGIYTMYIKRFTNSFSYCS